MSLPNIVIVVHGETERQLFIWLKKALRTDLIVHQPYGQGHTVSMQGSSSVLSAYPFDSYTSMHREFEDLDYDKNRLTMESLRVYPVVDVDGDGRTFRSYRSGDLFRNAPLRRLIVPIYNRPNLEAVLEQAGCGKVEHNIPAFRKMIYRQDPDRLREGLAGCADTNMDVLFDHIFAQCPSYQGRGRRIGG